MPLATTRPKTDLRLANGVRSILGNSGRFVGVNWIETAAAAAYYPVLAHYLGPIRYGLWAYGIAAYILVISLVGFGFTPLILMRLGRDKKHAGEFVGLTLTMRLALLAVGAAGLTFYALAVERDPRSVVVLLLFVPALIGRGIALWARICFLAYERVSDYVRLVTLLRAAEAGLGTAYLICGGGLFGIVALHSLFWLGEAALDLWRLHSRLIPYTLRFDWHPAREMLRQGAVLGLAAIGYTWLVSGPIMLLRHSGVTLAQLGQFAIVSSLTMILVNSAQAFATATLPALSRSALRTAPAIAGYGRLTALLVVAIAAVAAGIGWRLGPEVVQWTLGEHYALAGALLGPFLLIGGAVLAPTGYGQLLLVCDRRWPSAVADLAAGLCLAVAFSPAVAASGLDGAVATVAGAWSVRAAVLIGLGEWLAHRGITRSTPTALAGERRLLLLAPLRPRHRS